MRSGTLGAQAAVECVDVGVVGRFAGPRGVQRDLLRVSPEIEDPPYKLVALIDPDRVRIARRCTRAFKGRNPVFGPIADLKSMTD